MSRETDEQVLHDHVVALLQHSYYNYPSKQHPHLITFANHPMKSRGVKAPDGTEVLPDIVVFQGGNDKLVAVAEVETESTLDAAEAEEWRVFGSLGVKFYLYFPRGYGPKVVKLCAGIPVAEFIEYRGADSHYEVGRYTPAGM